MMLRRQEDPELRYAITGVGILGAATLLGLLPWAVCVSVGIVAFGLTRVALLGGRLELPVS